MQQISLATTIEKYAKALLWVLLLIVLFTGLALSGSRGGLLSIAGGLFFFGLLAQSRRLLRRWVIVLLIVGPIALMVIGLIAPTSLEKSFQRFGDEEFETSLAVRAEIWNTAWRIFQDFPWVGSGLGTFSHLSQRYQTFRWEFHMEYAESDVLQYLAETGAVGMGCLAWMGLAYFWRVLRLWKQRHSRQSVALTAGGLGALITLLLHGGVDFNLHIPSNALLFTVIAALSYTIISTRESGR